MRIKHAAVRAPDSRATRRAGLSETVLAKQAMAEYGAFNGINHFTHLFWRPLLIGAGRARDKSSFHVIIARRKRTRLHSVTSQR